MSPLSAGQRYEDAINGVLKQMVSRRVSEGCTVDALNRLFLSFVLLSSPRLFADEPPSLAAQSANVWIKRSPLPEGPVSPRLGYEGACVWDSRHRLLIRYGGHNQGGGGEQGAEVWTFDLSTGEWSLKEPNTSPPGVCCNAQNLYCPTTERYIRFPFFSGSHGWQWHRELYLNDSSVWTYDLATNRWRNMRPLPTPRLAPYRCASWDSDAELAVVFGGEGSHEGTLIYDPWRNQWRWPKPNKEPAPRSGGNMAYDAASKLHILFGSQFTDDPHTWAYDLRRNIWRDMRPAAMPPTDKNDAVLAYDPVHRVVLAIVKVTTGEGDNTQHEVQTWSYEASANKWTRLRPNAEPDSAGNRTRNLTFAPELNLAILENCTSRPREQQIWTYRYADSQSVYQPPPRNEQSTPAIVEDVVVSAISKEQVEIDWPAPSDKRITGYEIERAVVEVWSEDQLHNLKQRTPPLPTPSVGSIRRVGSFQQLTAQPIKQTSFVDNTVDLDVPLTVESEAVYDRRLHADHLDEAGRAYGLAVFAYRVYAVDESGKKSGPSPACFTIPSSPQHVFSRENETTCHLKWAANPEKGIVGYRVYRMDGRWNKDAVSRRTVDPIAETTFADESAGTNTCRYYVVAVDAVGQEGFPSSPVWFQREWRDYYNPFVGKWHQ